jgi:serine/threonine protein kinase
VFAAGTRIGKYELRTPLGKGGFGMVYVARDTELDRPCALKFLLPEHTAKGDILSRFVQEARSAAKIDHPGIVTVYECKTADDGSTYIAMELLKGESLSERLARGRIDPELALAIARQIASALEAAHAVGIVHRDLKPDNVFLVPDAESATGLRAKVLDFGIAKLAEGSDSGVDTNSLVIFGTPRYMSPEQCRSSASVSPASDIYSLGVMLFEMLCGERPFDGEPGALIAMHQMAPAPSLVDRLRTPFGGAARPGGAGACDRGARVDAELAALVASMLAKRPDERPRGMSDVVRRLEAIRSMATASAHLRMATGNPPDAPLAPTLPAVIAPAVTPSRVTPHHMPAVTPTLPLAEPKRRARWLVLGIVAGGVLLIAIPIVLAFRVLSSGCTDPRCMDATDAAMQVAGCRVSMVSYRYGFTGVQRLYGSARARGAELALESLLEREMLAQAAADAGIAMPSHADVEEHLGNAELVVLGVPLPRDSIYPDGQFEYRKFKNLAGEFGIPPSAFIDEQRREIQAARMRERLVASVAQVDRERVLAEWLGKRCRELASRDEIRLPNPGVFERLDDSGKPIRFTFVPCRRWDTPEPVVPLPVDAGIDASTVGKDDIIALSRFGYFTIAATAKTTIYIDDVKIGETPLTRLPLKPGVHKVKAIGPGGKTKKFEITIFGARDTEEPTITW